MPLPIPTGVMPKLQSQWEELRGGSSSVAQPAVQQSVEVNTNSGEEKRLVADNAELRGEAMAGKKQTEQVRVEQTEDQRSPIGEAVGVGVSVGSLAAIEAVATTVDARATELGISPVGTDMEKQANDMSADLRENGVPDDIAEAAEFGRASVGSESVPQALGDELAADHSSGMDQGRSAESESISPQKDSVMSI